jgi:hypothetical protein
MTVRPSPWAPSRELEALLHPSRAYKHPTDVLEDPDLTKYEKRAILSSWASDACAVENAPGARRPPGTDQPVSYDDVIDALCALDDEPTPPKPGGAKMRRRPPWNVDDGDRHGGSPLF